MGGKGWFSKRCEAVMNLSYKEKLARERLCLPLDGLDSLEEIRDRIDELKEVVGLFKVGKESFTRFGPAVIKLIHEYKREVFLDLKYHDIPNTVKGAATAATELGVYMFNVHASGGLEMMKAALDGANSVSQKHKIRRPKIIAVTLLTSIDINILNNEINVPCSVEEQVLRLAKLAHKAGLDGIVCSAADLHAIKSKLPQNFIFVTPGIKGIHAAAGADQKRIFTPGNAIKDGATILVAGRTITAHETSTERTRAGLEILKDMASSMPDFNPTSC